MPPGRQGITSQLTKANVWLVRTLLFRQEAVSLEKWHEREERKPVRILKQTKQNTRQANDFSFQRLSSQTIFWIFNYCPKSSMGSPWGIFTKAIAQKSISACQRQLFQVFIPQNTPLTPKAIRLSFVSFLRHKCVTPGAWFNDWTISSWARSKSAWWMLLFYIF